MTCERPMLYHVIVLGTKSKLCLSQYGNEQEINCYKPNNIHASQLNITWQ